MYGTAPCILHGTDAHDPADDQFYLKFYLRAKYTQGVANQFRCVHFHDPLHFGADLRANITGSLHVFPEHPFCRFDFQLTGGDKKDVGHEAVRVVLRLGSLQLW
ncbi:unnamed protein product, partial [Mesorhabditis spiculigera]